MNNTYKSRDGIRFVFQYERGDDQAPFEFEMTAKSTRDKVYKGRCKLDGKRLVVEFDGDWPECLRDPGENGTNYFDFPESDKTGIVWKCGDETIVLKKLD